DLARARSLLDCTTIFQNDISQRPGSPHRPAKSGFRAASDARKLRLLSGMIKASLSNENACSQIG
ncbi:hypothetical protein, partial [Bradyrhizobium sp.]|uniref:hypothetical protein n=1 Tax=Bradyrhizobium sp. TaxID=376 RepID=UPI003C265A50